MDVFPSSRLELGALDINRTSLFICDVQEKYRGVMNNFEDVVQNIKQLVTGCSHLCLPTVVSEQFPAGLGRTVKEVDIEGAALIASKEQFSMVVPPVEEILPRLCEEELTSVILVGMETHVAVEQTAIDLVSRGYQVHVVADCCTSRTVDDRNMALQRLMQIGCFVSTLETVLFKLIRTKSHPKFRAIAMVVKTEAKSNDLAHVL